MDIPWIKLKLVLEIFVKVFNILVKPKSFILELLIVEIYFCITKINIFLPTITKHIIAMQKAIKLVQKSNLFY